MHVSSMKNLPRRRGVLFTQAVDTYIVGQVLLVTFAWSGVPGPVFKARELLEECQAHAIGRAVALLGDDQFGFALKIRIIWFVDFFAKDETDYISILLNRTRFAQV